MPTMSVTK